MKRGRKSTYSDEIAEKICTHIADGKSLITFCKISGNPSHTAVFDWLRMYPQFADNYARARLAQADVFAEKIADVAENSTPETAQSDRVKIDALKWLAGKQAPKKWGDKQHVEISGDDAFSALLSAALSK